jgi:CHAT domain-containing protein
MFQFLTVWVVYNKSSPDRFSISSLLMTKNRNRIAASLCSYLGIVPKRLGYGLLAIAIAIMHIGYSITSVQAATPAALIQQGNIAYDRGDFPTALRIWEQAEAGYGRSRDPVGVVGSQLNRSQALTAMGLERRACKLVAGTVGVGEGVCTTDIPTKFGMRQTTLPPTLQAAAIERLGDVLRLLGNLDAAQVTLAQAFEIAKPLSAADRAPILVGIANTFRDLGTRDRGRTDRLQPPANLPLTCPTQPTGSLTAGAYYQHAIACYRQAGTLTADLDLLGLQVDISQWHRQEAAAQRIASSWQNQFNQPQLINQIARQLSSQPYTHTRSNQRINFARSLARSHPPQWQAATELINTVIIESQLKHQKLVSIEATGALGWLYEQDRQWFQAGKFTQQAIALATTADNDNLYQWEWQLGRILQHQSQPDMVKSQAAYDRAILALEKTRRNLQIVNPDAQFSLRDNVEPLYRESIDLSLRAQQPAFGKIIDRVDALKLAELENFLQCQLDVYKPINKFTEDAGAAIFYPVILADRLEVILQLGGKYQRFTVPVTRTQLEQTIATFGQNLAQPQYGWNEVAAAQLYDWLIRPAQQYLTPQTKNLVFVMDGALQNIPVAALYDRSRQEYLIDRYPVAVTPGLQILGAKRFVGNGSGILIGGLTSRATSAGGGKRGDIYEPLASAGDEVRAIKSRFTKVTTLVGRDFTQANLRRTLAGDSYSTIHLATHGRFSSDPHQTFIVTDGGKSIDLNSLRAILKQGASALDLLVLSACETATGDRRAALGLAGTAIRSGAASTLASLWAVDDRATAKLMQQFYTSLTQPDRATKAQALQVAQRTIRQEYPHPYYWAPFVLVGNWL